MSTIVLLDPMPLLLYSGALTASQTLQLNQVCVLGYRRIWGNFFSSAAVAAGWPKIQQSSDGVTFDLNDQVAQDDTQANFNYCVDIDLWAPYVSIQIKDAGAGSTVRCAIYALPG